MGWKLKNAPRTLKATPKLAKTYDEMDAAPHDRPLSERRLMIYERIARQGGFRPVSWASAYCTETGGTYRVNGKHTSKLLTTMKDAPDLYVVIEEYTCDTLEDVARLYATYDSKVSSRTANDIYRSFAAVVPEIRDLPHKHVALAIGAIAMADGAGTRGDGKKAQVRRSGESDTAVDRAEKLLDHIPFAVWLSGIYGGGTPVDDRDHRKGSKHLMRQPVAAAMFGGFNKSIAAATDFWTAVRDGSHPSREDATRKLERYLLTSGLETSGMTRHTRPVPTREMYVKCLHAWNAWRKGESTSLRYTPEADIPAIR